MNDVCPDCGKEPHNPRTGFCWKAGNTSKGYHCAHCCNIKTEEKNNE